ncbi:MAG: hypothetical protein COT35_11795 [Nitrospirae bacterium CG08_land_8_20_14_0_20_52_24]|nr:MAG: hypothetical protein COT35_11795 [Nitrospirae bacterium CG08_land_8_20_14_0_20_52_24]PIV84694.1 MAG: hypothetical protein COW52_06225 [Nitrospirae bacterium CG17_big_fil_post_rev_8_21_14_2_50_50_9]
MAFPPRELPEHLFLDLSNFRNRNDFVELYRSYNWNNDTHENGFPDILRLERQLLESDHNRGISLQDVKDVANWGNLRNSGRILGQEISLPPMTLHSGNGCPAEAVRINPMGPVRTLENNITRGIGPTYLSKILRFGLPQEYGAIDTRCVRVFGEGDTHAHQHDWLSLRARNYGYGWYIPRPQAAWPTAYDTWIDILRFFSSQLPKNCPHPIKFVEAGLRVDSVWNCADVEMALFSYASQFT